MGNPKIAASKPAALNSRDLINVGIFTTIYFVCLFALAMIGFAGPWFSALGYILGVLANGVVISLYLSRVPKFGALTLLSGLSSLLMLLTGHPWIVILVSTGVGFLADLIARSGAYRRPVTNILAYGVLSIWYVGPMLPIVWDTAAYTKYVADSMGKEYADLYLQIFGPNALPIWVFCFFVAGLAGGWFGQRLLRRQFTRAGVA